MSAPASELMTAGLVGAIVGSFVNVLVYRLPRGEPLVRPRSHCPGCGMQIAAYDNVPVVSWFMLAGRCRHCRAPISVRYPLIEALSAALFVAVALDAGKSAKVLPGLALVTLLVSVAAIDLEHRIVPNRILAPAAVLALVLWAIADPGRLPESLIAGASAAAFLLLAVLAYPSGMGMGDVKLAGVMGLFLGRSVAPALLIAFAAGALVGIGMLIVEGAAARKRGVPFAPFLALGGVVAQFWGPELVHWYLKVSGLG